MRSDSAMVSVECRGSAMIKPYCKTGRLRNPECFTDQARIRQASRQRNMKCHSAVSSPSPECLTGQGRLTPGRASGRPRTPNCLA